MMAFLTNWKTSLAGIAAVLLAIGTLLKGLSAGDTSGLVTQISALIAGFGLLFAKDATPPTTPPAA